MLGIIRFVFFFFPLSPATWIERRFEGISCNRTRLTPSPSLDRFEFPTRVSASHNPWKNVELNGTPRYRPCIIRLIMKKVRVIASFADLVERKKRGGEEEETEQLLVNYIGARFHFYSYLSLSFFLNPLRFVFHPLPPPPARLKIKPISKSTNSLAATSRITFLFFSSPSSCGKGEKKSTTQFLVV